MIYDLYTLYHISKGKERETIKRIASDKDIDIPTRIQLLAAAIHLTWTEKDRKDKEKEIRGKDVAFEEYKRFVFKSSDIQTSYATEVIEGERCCRMNPLGLWQPSRPNFSLLPPHSAFIQFTFTLAKPYISRDDEPFHINDNPVRKDKVFKVPMVAPTNWKGNLRWTARQLEPSVDEKTIVRLFGNKKDEEENHLAGALHFYPTFFDRIGLEVINPHDRKTRTGKQPIYFECVPVGATGTFSLLYAPLPNGEHNEQQAHDDLKVVAKAIAAMMLTYGFSAKKSSGYGETHDEIEGNVSTIQGNYPLTSLEKLTEEVAHVKWS